VILAAVWSAIGLASAGLIYRWRHRTIRLCAVIVFSVMALFVALVSTAEVAPRLVADAAKISVGTVVLTIIAALLIARALPRLSSRNDRGRVILICGAIAVCYVAIGAFLAAAADDQSRVGAIPQLRTREDFIAQRDAASPSGGVLMEAALSDRNPVFDDGVVASISCPAIGTVRLPGTARRLPERYLLDFPGGPPVIAAGVESSLQTWGWPAAGGSSGECAVRRGTAVVIWADVRKGMGSQASTSQTGLADTRMIAVGDIASFIREYTPVAHRTAKAVYGLAWLNLVLGILMIAVGAGTWRRLTRTGNADHPRITWRTW